MNDPNNVIADVEVYGIEREWKELVVHVGLQPNPVEESRRCYNVDDPIKDAARERTILIQ